MAALVERMQRENTSWQDLEKIFCRGRQKAKKRANKYAVKRLKERCVTRGADYNFNARRKEQQQAAATEKATLRARVERFYASILCEW